MLTSRPPALPNQRRPAHFTERQAYAGDKDLFTRRYGRQGARVLPADTV